MTATEGTYTLLSLAPYRDLFPQAQVIDITAKKGADVSDTVAFIPGVIWKTRWQVKRFVEKELANLPTEKALMKLWFWVKCHIPYGPDKRGKEQVKTPRRTVHDAAHGIGSDCDDMTTFVSACASYLGGIKQIIHTIAKYGGPNWQHIYPTIVLDSGRRIIMDCVTDAYNYEKKPTQREEHIMDLELLDGIDDYDMGKISIKNIAKNVANAVKTEVKTAGQAISTAAKKTGEAIKDNAGNALHAINKVNPATVLLRTGVLAAMKMNMLNVAGRLRWAYLSDSEAQKRGIDKSGHEKLKKIMSKLEEIFHGAGGEPSNLKKEILEGKGNKDHSVAGLGTLSVYSPLHEVLEPETYASEVSTVQGLGQLGEVVTATSLAAASGAIATIAALLKQVGNLFPKGSSGAKDFDAGDQETPDTDTPSTASLVTNITNAANMVKQVLPDANKQTQLSPNLPAFSATKESYERSLQTNPPASKPSLLKQLMAKRNAVVSPAPEVNTSFSPQGAPEQTTPEQTTPEQTTDSSAFVQPTVVPPKDYVPMPDNTPEDTKDKKEEKKDDTTKRPAWVMPTIIVGSVLVLGGISLAIYRAGQKRKMAERLMSRKQLNGTEEMGYVLVEETQPAPKAESKAKEKPESLEGFVLVEETQPAPIATSKAKEKPESLEGFVVVEETAPAPKASDPQPKQKPESLEGFVLVEEQKPAPAERPESKKEDYVLVEESASEKQEELLEAIPLM